MKVLQHTRSKRNLFFKPDRADRNYRDRLLIIDSLFDSQNAIVYSMIVFFFFFFFFFLHELSVESRIDTGLFVIQLRKQQCDINETLFCSGSTEHIFIEITNHQGRLQQNKILLNKSHLQQHFPFLSSNF